MKQVFCGIVGNDNFKNGTDSMKIKETAKMQPPKSSEGGL